MSTYEPIDCNDYDFLEIACMDGYDICVQLDAGQVQGIAKGLETRAGEEFLCLLTASGKIQEVRIDRIRQIHVMSKPARFKKHVFASDPSRQ